VETGSDRSNTVSLCVSSPRIEVHVARFDLFFCRFKGKRISLSLHVLDVDSTKCLGRRWREHHWDGHGHHRGNCSICQADARQSGAKDNLPCGHEFPGCVFFLNLPVGRYDLTVVAPGFSAKKVTSLLVDTDASLRADVALAVGGASDTVTVNSNTGAQVDTSSTHLGEVVTGAEMTALPLNGRSFTDLLSIQPGVAPASTLLPNAVIMAGVTGGISPSGDENPGNVSINGQRESSNGFMVNGMDVQEHMNGGTSVVPTLIPSNSSAF
jgi:hypothetical protein